MSQPQQKPNVPPQDTPLFASLDRRATGNIFSLVWWKFFQLLVDWINWLQDEIDAIVPGTTASYIQDLGILSSGPTTITSPVATPNEGDSLTVFWQQPSGGGEQIAWDAIFQQVTSNDNDVRPNRTSAVSFKAKSDNLWYPIAFVMGRL